MAQHVHVQLQLLSGRREREHLIVKLGEARARAQQVQAHAHPRDVRVDRYLVQAVGEQQHAGRRLAPNAWEPDEVVARLLERRVCDPVQRELVQRVSGVG